MRNEKTFSSFWHPYFLRAALNDERALWDVHISYLLNNLRESLPIPEYFMRHRAPSSLVVMRSGQRVIEVADYLQNFANINVFKFRNSTRPSRLKLYVHTLFILEDPSYFLIFIFGSRQTIQLCSVACFVYMSSMVSLSTRVRNTDNCLLFILHTISSF